MQLPAVVVMEEPGTGHCRHGWNARASGTCRTGLAGLRRGVAAGSSEIELSSMSPAALGTGCTKRPSPLLGPLRGALEGAPQTITSLNEIN